MLVTDVGSNRMLWNLVNFELTTFASTRTMKKLTQPTDTPMSSTATHNTWRGTVWWGRMVQRNGASEGSCCSMLVRRGYFLRYGHYVRKNSSATADMDNQSDWRMADARTTRTGYEDQDDRATERRRREDRR